MSSSSNPRKFSEKIAIQQRKLNEEQSAFQQIMNEVHTITRFPTPVNNQTAQGLGPPAGTQFMGAAPSGNWRVASSLPNVFAMAYPQGPDIQSLDQTNYQMQWPGPSMPPPSHHHHDSLVQHHQPRTRSPQGPHYHPYRTPSPHHPSPGGGSSPRGHSPERPQLTPPTQSNSYLVPPSDGGWRRTHSDPGIHASVTHPNQIGFVSGVQQTYAPPTPPQNNSSPGISSGKGVSSHGDISQVGGYLDPKVIYRQDENYLDDDDFRQVVLQGNYDANSLRPRSCENSPHMPTLSIHPSENVAGPQVPISSNTGSLPDLSQLPQAPMQTLENALPSQPPPYATHMVGVGGQMAGVSSAASVAHQQRHSIQLPVQYAQGNFPAFAQYNFNSQSGSPSSYSQGSPGYQPESPHSGPNSPAATGNPESPSAAGNQQNQSSPGSPYYSLPAQLQNINIDSSDLISNQAYYSTGQQFKMPPNPYGQQQQQQQQHQNQQQQQQLHQQQQYILSQQGIPGGMQQQQSMYNQLQQQQQLSRMCQQQQQQQRQQQIMTQQQYGQQMQQPLPSPKSGQTPNIILTGPNDSMNAGMGMMPAHASYVDPTVEILSSDLRMTLDPSDLESLQVLSNENDLIDAASEDALRRDRI